MQTAMRLLQPSAVSRQSQEMGSVSLESAAAVTVMAATAANGGTPLNAAKETKRSSLLLKATQHLLIQSQNRLQGSKNWDKPLLNL